MATKIPVSVLSNACNPVLGRAIAPPWGPELLASKAGCMKVKLIFHTPEPKHIRNIILKQQYGIAAPYTEEICILMPAKKVFALLETFLPAFEKLKQLGVFSSTAQLTRFQLLDEDESTLAYLF